MLFGISELFKRKNIIYKDITGSTNLDLKEMAKNGAKEGTVVITEQQTDGKGRLGKSFYSPKGCGLYFSILLRPKISPDDAPLITVAAAVSVKRAISAIYGNDTKIKWVNDIYYNGKKFCGILTESSISSKNNRLDFAVLGIGINLKLPDNLYPEEFAYKTTAVSEFANKIPEKHKEMLFFEILKEFNYFYKNLKKKEFLKEYKDSSCVIGNDIEILSGEYKGKAKAIDIDDNANLVVILENGKKAVLGFGDVSIHI